MTRKTDTPSSHSIKIKGTVERIIPANSDSPEMAQIFISCSDGTFAEIRIKNRLQNQQGKLVALPKGTLVEITIRPDRNRKPMTGVIPVRIIP
jgi:hypothetical protein